MNELLIAIMIFLNLKYSGGFFKECYEGLDIENKKKFLNYLTPYLMCLLSVLIFMTVKTYDFHFILFWII